MLEEDAVPRVIDVLDKELAGSGVLYIGRPGAHDHLFRRTLHLVNGAASDAPGLAAASPSPAVSKA